MIIGRTSKYIECTPQAAWAALGGSGGGRRQVHGVQGGERRRRRRHGLRPRQLAPDIPHLPRREHLHRGRRRHLLRVHRMHHAYLVKIFQVLDRALLESMAITYCHAFVLQAVWSGARREDPMPGEAHVWLCELPESGDGEHHSHEAQPTFHLRIKGPR